MLTLLDFLVGKVGNSGSCRNERGHTMNEAETIATWDLLQEFGFQLHSEEMFDVNPGLEFDFGNFKLVAFRLINMTFREVVSFSGVLATPRTVAQVDFEMPLRVASREQCGAWRAWHLDQAANGNVFTRDRPAEWLAEGKKHQHLLPWERERAEREREWEQYRSRPHCTPQRQWLKLALKTLAEHLTDSQDGEPVEIGFDGKVLSFRLAEKVVVLAAQGTPWKSQFTLLAGKLRNLPKRLMNAYVDVSVWRSQLKIDRSTYDGIVERLNGQKESAL